MAREQWSESGRVEEGMAEVEKLASEIERLMAVDEDQSCERIGRQMRATIPGSFFVHTLPDYLP
jgi:hypothetical protein